MNKTEPQMPRAVRAIVALIAVGILFAAAATLPGWGVGLLGVTLGVALGAAL